MPREHQDPELAATSPPSDEGSIPVHSPHPRQGANRVRDLDMGVHLQEMDRCLDILQGMVLAKEDDLGFTTEFPFGAHIMLEALPRHFKTPQLETYDGTRDPIDHLQGFKTTMLL